MADCVVILKSGKKLEIEGVDLKTLTTAIENLAKSSALINFQAWGNLILNFNEVAAIYQKGTGIESD